MQPQCPWPQRLAVDFVTRAASRRLGPAYGDLDYDPGCIKLVSLRMIRGRVCDLAAERKAKECYASMHGRCIQTHERADTMVLHVACERLNFYHGDSPSRFPPTPVGRFAGARTKGWGNIGGGPEMATRFYHTKPRALAVLARRHSVSGLLYPKWRSLMVAVRRVRSRSQADPSMFHKAIWPRKAFGEIALQMINTNVQRAQRPEPHAWVPDHPCRHSAFGDAMALCS